MMRVGLGFDVHAFAEVGESRPLKLMGCLIPHDRGLKGHSDADVMIHALMDALLGAAGLGDIGQHFSDRDPAYKNADSLGMLKHVISMLNTHGWRVVNADICLMGERPKIAPYHEQMKNRVAPILGIDALALNIKATTTEKLGFTGREEGLAAQAVVLIEKA